MKEFFEWDRRYSIFDSAVYRSKEAEWLFSEPRGAGGWRTRSDGYKRASRYHYSMTQHIADCLLLRRWRETDCKVFARINADPRVMEYHPAPPTPEQADAEIDRCGGHFGVSALPSGPGCDCPPKQPSNRK